jgi:hypothetical protein
MFRDQPSRPRLFGEVVSHTTPRDLVTADVLAAHLKGDAHVGVYPLLDGDRCWWLAADFDGQDALTEALMYVKAGRAFEVPVALEVSRSGIGMHAWTFFLRRASAGRDGAAAGKRPAARGDGDSREGEPGQL